MKSTYSKRNGHQREGGQHKDLGRAATARRQGALKRLENQLLTGFKPVKNEDSTMGTTALTDHDKKRIQKEIEVLKESIKKAA